MVYPIKGFIEVSFSDWPGKMAAVLFLPSCNFRCPYCQNHELVLLPGKYPDYPFPEILEKLRRQKGWIDGVCISGGEPTLHPWLPGLIRDLKAAGGEALRMKLDTNGSHPETLKALIDEGLLDYVALDIKGPLEENRYAAAAGISLRQKGLSRIQESIEILLAGKVEYEFRTTVVPTLIAEEEVYTLARQLKGARRYTLQNFSSRDPLQESFKNTPPFDEPIFRRMQEQVNEMIH
jgi:pyruvate formate lyase activating enzyme